MELKEFDYQLPNELIATEPSKTRNRARLLCLYRSGELKDKFFSDLTDILQPGDVLVFNDSKVIPARLKGISEDREYEILLVKNVKGDCWECWLKPGRRAKVGSLFDFGDDLSAVLVERRNNIFVMKFSKKGEEFFTILEKIGKVPLPPYILKQRRLKNEKEYKKSDQKNYQTIYAKTPGSVAAPTAGLHFDQAILERLNKIGVQTEKVTLHVGLGTFEPIKTTKIEDFNIHSEYLEINEKTARNLNAAKSEGRRIIAVGTTTVRVLESAATKGRVRPMKKETKIFIYPGYKFKFIDGLITNFHLPKSSLLLLVSAFAGCDQTKNAYQYAISNQYQFYSYGDGMLIL